METLRKLDVAKGYMKLLAEVDALESVLAKNKECES